MLWIALSCLLATLLSRSRFNSKFMPIPRSVCSLEIQLTAYICCQLMFYVKRHKYNTLSNMMGLLPQNFPIFHNAVTPASCCSAIPKCSHLIPRAYFCWIGFFNRIKAWDERLFFFAELTHVLNLFIYFPHCLDWLVLFSCIVQALASAE